MAAKFGSVSAPSVRIPPVNRPGLDWAPRLIATPLLGLPVAKGSKPLSDVLDVAVKPTVVARLERGFGSYITPRKVSPLVMVTSAAGCGSPAKPLMPLPTTRPLGETAMSRAAPLASVNDKSEVVVSQV